VVNYNQGGKDGKDGKGGKERRAGRVCEMRVPRKLTTYDLPPQVIHPVVNGT
jgi:hypothetical protein